MDVFIQNDLWTLVSSTSASRWKSRDLAFFDDAPFVSWDLHPFFHWKPVVLGQPDTGFGIPYDLAGHQTDSEGEPIINKKFE